MGDTSGYAIDTRIRYDYEYLEVVFNVEALVVFADYYTELSDKFLANGG